MIGITGKRVFGDISNNEDSLHNHQPYNQGKKHCLGRHNDVQMMQTDLNSVSNYSSYNVSDEMMNDSVNCTGNAVAYDPPAVSIIPVPPEPQDILYHPRLMRQFMNGCYEPSF